MHLGFRRTSRQISKFPSVDVADGKKMSGAGLASPPNTPPQERPLNFDIVSHYNRLLKSDPSTTAPIAAIESLIATLSASPPSTISETLSLLRSASSTLLKSQQNPIPLSAGTDLFQRYIITSFQQTPNPSQSGSDFTQLRNQLIKNSKLFVSRAKTARSKIAEHALPLIQDDSTIVVYGDSRVVNRVLTQAAEAGRYFHVIFVSSPSLKADELNEAIDKLKSLYVPVAKIPLSALSHSLSSLPKGSISTSFFLGSEAVLENGSSISAVGSQLVAEIAKARGIPVYITAESYKFVRSFPLSYGDNDLAQMGAKQHVLEFQTSKTTDQGMSSDDKEAEMKDITPAHLISALVTENGVMTPNAVAEELIKLWF